MAVDFDAKFEKGASNPVSPFSFQSDAGTVAGTIGSGSNRFLLGYAAFRTAVGTHGTIAMTWDGVSMTQIGSATASAGPAVMYLFALIAPNSGAKALACSYSASQDPIVTGGISFTGADQTTGYADFTTATGAVSPATITVPNMTVGDYSAGGRIDNNATSATIQNGTQAWDERNFNGNYGGVYQADTGTLGWTLGSSQAWCMAAIRILQAAVVVKTKLLVRV